MLYHNWIVPLSAIPTIIRLKERKKNNNNITAVIIFIQWLPYPMAVVLILRNIKDGRRIPSLGTMLQSSGWREKCEYFLKIWRTPYEHGKSII